GPSIPRRAPPPRTERRCARRPASGFRRVAPMRQQQRWAMRRGQGRSWAHDSAGAPVRTSKFQAAQHPLRRRTKLCSFPRKRESRAKDWVPAFAGTNGGEGHTGAHARRAPGTMDLRARACYHGHCPMHGITTLQRMPKNVAAALAITATLAAGVAGGFAARYVHLPLPWLLGALFTTMTLSLAGAPV